MQSNFTRLKRNCPICQGDRLDCRQSHLTNLIFCRSDRQEAAGYKMVGEDGHGFFLWAVDSGRKGYDAEEARRKREEVKAQRIAVENERKARSLSATARDREINKVLASLVLRPEHQQDLERRGLSTELIKAGQFRSVSQWQKLDFEVNNQLAGVGIDGRSLVTQSGYLCPIRNLDQKIVGWQLRSDDPTEGKYKWASSVTKKRPNGGTSHLPNGELPLNVAMPVEGTGSRIVRLSEGILKSWVLAQFRGDVSIGAAGGNFASSPETLKETLKSLRQQRGRLEIVLEPDAGAVKNQQVMEQYRRTYQLVRKCGYDLRVNWWGQIDKDGGYDPDEWRGASQFITFAQFEAIAQAEKNPERVLGQIKNILANGCKAIAQRLPAQKEKTEKPTESAKSAIALNEYEEGGRIPAWIDLAENERFILDVSDAGLGKSHSVGELEPVDFGVEKLLYLSSDHRNPTVQTIEEGFVDNPVRHNGMRVDYSRMTPGGSPYIVHFKDGEDGERTEGNCHRSHLFQFLAEKNLDNISVSQESPICGGCHLANACKMNSGAGFGYRNQRHKAFENKKIRSHPDSLPSDYNYGQTALIWDEVGTLLNPVKSVAVAIADFDKSFAELANRVPGQFNLLMPALLKIRQVLNKEIKSPTRHGWSDEQARELLGERPEGVDIEAIAQALTPDLEFIKEEDGITFGENRNVRGSASAHAANEMLRRGQYREVQKQLENVGLNWLVPLLKVWGREEKGTIALSHGKMLIHTHNSRLIEIAKSAKVNIFLDATISPEQMAMMLGVEVNAIAVVKQKSPDYSNLTIHLVKGMGKLTKDRSEGLKERVEALKTELKARHEGIAIFDWKKFANEGEGYHFRDGRGINRFEGAKAIALFGAPYPNIGAIASRYQILSNGEMTLDEYLGQITEAELIQEIGRLRAHRRPNEALDCYLVMDVDPAFLEAAMPGCKIVEVEAFEMSPAAGSRLQQTKRSLVAAFKTLQDSAQKITQNALAAIAGITQGRISQIAQEAGGWEALKKILVSLLDPLYSVSNNFEPVENQEIQEVSEEDFYLATEHIPLLLEEESGVYGILECFKNSDNLENLISTLETGVKLRIFGLLCDEAIA